MRSSEITISVVLFPDPIRTEIASMVRKGVSSYRHMNRGGFTILALVIVLMMIGILVSIVLPTIQYFRQAVRRTQCQNNMRQMALACHALGVARRSGYSKLQDSTIMVDPFDSSFCGLASIEQEQL
jgi:competence protein ComGC